MFKQLFVLPLMVFVWFLGVGVSVWKICAGRLLGYVLVVGFATERTERFK